MNTPTRKTKVALLINMISPARVSLYSALADAFDLLILHGGSERNRTSWRGFERDLPKARVKRAWGWQIAYTRKHASQAFDERYLHINPGYAWELVRFAPDIVITSEMGVRTVLALFYGAFFARPVWVWWGGTVHTERNKAGRIKRMLRGLLARLVRHWISYGQSSTQYLVSLGIPQERILELQNTADERYFQTPSRPQFRLHPKPVLLYVGQFIARKGIDQFLRAAAALQKQGRMFSLLLIGNGPDRQASELLAHELNLRNVYFHPAQMPQSMPGVYRSADVLVFPTLEDPWGLVASEAMLAGIPVLCSKYAGCAGELLPDECIFDPEDPAEFQRKLCLAVNGQLPPPDLARLKTSAQVARVLIANLQHAAVRRCAPPAESRKLTIWRRIRTF